MRMRRLPICLGYTVVLWLLGAMTGVGSEDVAGHPLAVEQQRLERVFRLTDDLYSGAAPEGVDGFAALASMGVRTILSVDGARPQVELARQFGLTYIQIPIGYGGISRETSLRLVKAAVVAEGPLYVHCHHGRHRGPAAAAVMCRGTADWSADQAIRWLEKAETGRQYQGLYQSVRSFEPPSKEDLSEIPNRFPEIDAVSDLVSSMVEIDQHWEHLVRAKKSDHAGDADRVGRNLAEEALLIQEGFRELQRLAEVEERGGEFIELLRGAEKNAERLHSSLLAWGEAPTENRFMAVESARRGVSQQCAQCHHKFRD
jgi:protein tyrosine phosphatase (PTP) superfamily phosphohydrolase (DUF442 family)